MYNCEYCSKEHPTADSLRFLTLRDLEGFFNYIVCEEPCANKVRDDPEGTVIIDEPFVGTEGPEGGVT